ncbi:ATP-binding protein [Streptomyces sp. NPDC016566]|uniref:ATP-binding protein n=1 Tax=Streptomyces sp. NPDC016566 TaxID=3364967 RepID=UPI0036F902E6
MPPATVMPYRSVYAPVAASVPKLRREASATLSRWHPPLPQEALDRALLIISELVSNTVRHTSRYSPRAELTLSFLDDSLDIAVHDGDPRLPVIPPSVHWHRTGGRGMRLVQDLVVEAGGRFEVRSAPGRTGTAVFASLPL